MSIRPRTRWAHGAVGLWLAAMMGCQAQCSKPEPNADYLPRGLEKRSTCVSLWRPSLVDVSFKEEPEDAVHQRVDTRLERRFTVARQLRGAYRHQDRWASVLEYAEGPVRGGVSYTFQVPDVLADLTGQSVQWVSHREPGSCLSKEDGEIPVLLTGDTLRDAQGRLLLLTVPSAPTTIRGDVLLPEELVPELRFHWENAGCRLAGGTYALDVRLHVEATNPAARMRANAMALPGEPDVLTLDGVRYVFKVARATADMQGRCGQAVFSLIREDLLEQR